MWNELLNIISISWSLTYFLFLNKQRSITYHQQSVNDSREENVDQEYWCQNADNNKNGKNREWHQRKYSEVQRKLTVHNVNIARKSVKQTDEQNDRSKNVNSKTAFKLKHTYLFVFVLFGPFGFKTHRRCKCHMATFLAIVPEEDHWYPHRTRI